MKRASQKSIDSFTTTNTLNYTNYPQQQQNETTNFNNRFISPEQGQLLPPNNNHPISSASTNFQSTISNSHLYPSQSQSHQMQSSFGGQMPQPQQEGTDQNIDLRRRANPRVEEDEEKIQTTKKSKSKGKHKEEEDEDEKEDPKDPIVRLKKIRMNRIKNQILLNEVNFLKDEYDELSKDGGANAQDGHFTVVEKEMYRLQDKVVRDYTDRSKFIRKDKNKSKSKSKGKPPKKP